MKMKTSESLTFSILKRTLERLICSKTIKAIYLNIALHYENIPNSDTLKPHFYIVKLGFTGVDIIFLISTQKPRIPSIYVLSRNMKNIRIFLSETFPLLVVKFSIYLNRRVFVMSMHNMY